MQLNENGFWAKVYRGSRRICFRFVDSYGNVDDPRTNLCTFVRTIFVWAPLVIALNIACVAAAVFSAGSLLYVLWFNLSVIGGVALAVVIIAAAVTGIIYLHLGARKLAKSETAKLAKEYMAAKKSMICPLIQITGGDHASA